jgi:hypothetical protein
VRPNRFLAAEAFAAVVALPACRAPRAARAPALVRPPAGADSAAVATWLAEQTRRCRGRLSIVVSPVVVFDSTGRRGRYVEHLEGMACRRR